MAGERERVIERLVAEFGADASEMLGVFDEIDQASDNTAKQSAKAAKETEKNVRAMAKAILAEIKKSSKESEKASLAAAKAATDAANKAANSAAASAQAVENALGATGGFIGTVVQKAVSEIIRIGQQVLKEAKTFDEMRRRIGTTTEAVSTLTFVVDQFGFSMGDLEGILTGTRDSLNVTGEDAEKMDAILEDVGVTVADLKDQTPDQQLLSLADAFSRTKDEGVKARAATGFFGAELANRMIPLLNKGRDGLEAAQEEARKFGLEISSDFGRKAVEFDNNMKRLNAQFDAFNRQLVSATVPAVNDVLEAFLKGSRGGSQFEGAVDALGVAWERWKKVVSSQEGTEQTLAQLQDIEIQIEALQSRLGRGEGFSLAKLLGGIGDPERLEKQLETLLEQRKVFEKALQDDLESDREAARKKQLADEEAFQKELAQRKATLAAEAAAKRQAVIDRETEATIESAEAQLQSLKRLTTAETLRAQIRDGEFKDFSAQSIERLESLANEIEIQTALNKKNDEAKARAEELAKLQEQARAFAKSEVENLTIQIQMAQARTDVERTRIMLQSERFAALTEEERIEIENLNVRLTAVQKEKQAREDLQNFAKTIAQETLSLREQEIQAVNKLNEAFQAGLISQEEFSTALGQTTEKFDRLNFQANLANDDIFKFGVDVAKSLGSNFKEFLFDPTEEGFLNMARQFVESINKMAAQALTKSIFGGLFGQSPRGGGGGIFGRGFGAGGFAEGGAVHGPGTGTSDSIVARLSDGEFVVRAAMVRQYGLGFMESLNRGLLSSISRVQVPQVNVSTFPRFATGGLVEAPPPPTAGATEVNATIVNVQDQEQFFTAMASARGTDIIVNTIGDNARTVNRVLKNG